jgi:hypothetical protein
MPAGTRLTGARASSLGLDLNTKASSARAAIKPSTDNMMSFIVIG